jgi:hypothetical protein
MTSSKYFWKKVLKIKFKKHIKNIFQLFLRFEQPKNPNRGQFFEFKIQLNLLYIFFKVENYLKKLKKNSLKKEFLWKIEYS